MHNFSNLIQVLFATSLIQLTTSMTGYFLHAVDDYHRGIWVNEYEYKGCCTDIWANGHNFNYSIAAEPGDRLKLKVENFSGRQGFVGIVQLGQSAEGRFDSNTYDSYWSNPDGITRYSSGYNLYGTNLDLLGNNVYKYSYYTFLIPYFSTCDNYSESFTINTLQAISWNFDSWINSKIPNAERTNRLYIRFRAISFGDVIVEDTWEVVKDEENYPLDIDYKFKPSINIYGQFTWYYYGYSISEDSSSDCKVNINICYFSCSTCSSTENLTSTDHKCLLCLDGYAKVEINGVVDSNCYEISWIQQQYPNYYHDQSSNTYYPCFEICSTCQVKGNSDNHSCSSCDKSKDWHLIVSHPGNCVYSPQKGYYLDEETNTYFNCYSSCAECDGIGSENNNYCTKCNDSFIGIDKTQNCVAEKPERYYLTVDGDWNQIYKECYSTCNICELGGDEWNHNCESCNSSFFYLEGNNLNCFHIDTIPSNTYLTDGTKYKYCYSSCATCNTKGDETENKCLSCNSPNYWNEIDFNCYQRNDKPENFYYDDVNRIFKKCYSTCATCTIGGSDSVHNCNSCIEDYSFITKYPSNCIDKLTQPENFYHDSTDNTFKPCHTDCQTCSIGPDSKTPSIKNCKTCRDNYYFLSPRVDGNCIHENTKPSNYYLDEESQTYNQCYDTCKLCDKGGDDSVHHCEECLSTEYHWEGLNSNNCIHQDNQPINTYLDEELDAYWPCHSNCSACVKKEEANKNNCMVCKEKYYFIDNVEDGNCIDINDKPSNYYLLDDKIFKPCFNSCATCSIGGTKENNNCSTCDNNYHWIIKHEFQCVHENDKPENYYLDTDDTYKPCHEYCRKCLIINNDSSTNCLECIENYFFWVEKEFGNCINKRNKPDDYYLDTDDTYKKCHENCSTCETGAIEGDTKCMSCSNTYFFDSENSTNCVNVIPEGYYRYGDVLKPCYNSCKTCSIGPSQSQDTIKHNCDICKEDYYWTIDIESNCINNDEKPKNYYWDETGEGAIFLPCYVNCQKCYQRGTSLKNNCDLCLDGLFFIEPLLNGNCINISSMPDDYYFNGETNIIHKCYETCSSCSTGYDMLTLEHNCSTCKENYFYLSSTSTSCTNIIPLNYYLFIDSPNNKQYLKPCFTSCAKCSNDGNETAHSCTQCKDNFYWIETQDSNCIQDSEKPINYYLDKNDSTYKACHFTCQTCSKPKINSSNNCDSCLSGSYFLAPKYEGNCITEKPDSYYWDEADGTFHQCYESCSECDQGSETINSILFHNCNKCKLNYYFENWESSNCITDIPEGSYGDGDVIRWCYDSCLSCTAGLDGDKHNCDKCKPGYSWYSWIKKNCIKESEKPENYYYDEKDDTYKPCNKYCKSCTEGEDYVNNKGNCKECWEDYYFLIDKLLGNCISEWNKPDDYYLDTDDTYKKCHENCSTCETGAIEGDTKCMSCSNTYFFDSENSTNCVNVIPEGYYRYGDVLKPCYNSCKTCSIGPSQSQDTIKHNCDICKEDYYWTIDIESNCINNDEKPKNYYWDEIDGIFNPCHENCSKCLSGPNKNKNNCNACIKDYVFIGDKSNGNCIDKTLVPANYYFNESEGTYRLCYESCGSCSSAADTLLNIHNCWSCIQNYYFQSESSSNCINSAPPKHYWDTEKQTYYPCYMSCDSCNIGGNKEKHNCDTCILYFHWIFDTEKNCINEDDKPSNYYYDKMHDMFKPCHNNCKACNIGEDSFNYNCLICNDGYFFRLPINEGNCVDTSDSKTDKYYFDDNKEVFVPCDINCSSCKAGKDGENSNCDTCIDNYYFWENDETGLNCYNSSPYENYYFDSSSNIFKQCYLSCQSCSWGFIENKHNCNTCKINYYFIEGFSTNCIKEDEKPENYYWDTTDAANHIYKQCHELCKSCNLGGTEGNNNCWTCVSGEYALIASKPNNCIPITDEIDNYYYDETTKAFEHCFGSCLRCNAKGFSNLNNCSQCINNYAFIESQPNNCIKKGSQPKNYFYDETDNTYKYRTNCFSTCESCFKEGNTETHYCLECWYNWEYTTGSPEKSNCYDLNTITLKEITLKDFIPLDQYKNNENEESEKPFEFKEIKIENYTMYYYTTRSELNNKNIPYILLNECEEIIRSQYNINEDKDIIIGEIVNIESSNIIEYKIFLQTGEEVDLQVCFDNNKWIDMHLYMLRERVNNSEIVSVQNKINVITNKIQIDDWFNTNSSFYNDPCWAFSIDNKDYTLSLRQEIYEKDIFTCGKDCAYNISFISNNTLICKCNTNNEGSIDDVPFKESNSSILSCLHLLSSFPAFSVAWAHWIICGAIGLQIAGCSLFWFLNAKDLAIEIAKAITNPPQKNNLNNKSIELQDLGHGNITSFSNSRSLNPNSNYWKSSVRILQKKDEVSFINIKEKQGNDNKEKHTKQEKKYISEELNNLNKSDSFKYDKRSFSRYFLDILKEKLIIISLFTHERKHLPISIQIIIQTFIFSLIFSLSSFFSTEESITNRFSANSIFFHLITQEIGSAVSIGWISYLIGRILIVLLKYDLYDKKNSTKEGWKFVRLFKTKVIIISSTTWIVNVMLWIYIFVFGMVYPNNQLTVFILSIISIILILTLQILICLVLTYLRNWTRKYKNSQCLFSISFFAYWLL